MEIGKTFCGRTDGRTDGRTEGRTHLNSNLLGHRRGDDLTRKPRKGAAVIAASMHGFANCRKFKSPVTLTLTLQRVKVMSIYAERVELVARPTM